MITSRLGPRRRRYFEIWARVVSLAISVWFTCYCIGLVWDAYEFGDKSDGLLSIPMWIPQAMMAFGIGLLGLSLFEEVINVLRGRKPIYQQRAEAAIEPGDEDDTGARADHDRKI